MKKPNLSKRCVLCVVVAIMLAVDPLLCGRSNPTEPIDMSPQGNIAFSWNGEF